MSAIPVHHGSDNAKGRLTAGAAKTRDKERVHLNLLVNSLVLPDDSIVRIAWVYSVKGLMQSYNRKNETSNASLYEND